MVHFEFYNKDSIYGKTVGKVGKIFLEQCNFILLLHHLSKI